MLKRLNERLEPSFTSSSMTARVTSITVGRVKDKHISSLCLEFSRKLGRYCTFNEIELRDARRGKAQSDARIQEAKEILAAIPKNAYAIALDERGVMKTTVEFARVCEKIEMQMTNHICFIIGGPDGLDEAVKDKASLLLALSPFTFTHELARAVLYEQLYRVYSFRAGHPYHRI